MKIKRPEKYYKVEYATSMSEKFYAVQFIADCLTLDSAFNACKEAVQIHGWTSGAFLVKFLETRTNKLISRGEIGMEDVIFEIEGEKK